MMTSDIPKKRSGPRLTDELPAVWRPIIEFYGGKAALARVAAVSYSTLNRWTFADVRGTPQFFPVRSRLLIQSLAKQAGVTDPAFAIPAVCPLCLGKKIRTYTAEERASLGLKPLRDGEAPDIFPCDCQMP